MFNRAKEEILKLIETSPKLVTNKTKFDTCEVYLLYVDNFQDDRILPIYIGQVKKGSKHRSFSLGKICSL